MAVLVEGISVIVRREAIDRKYAGGSRAFMSAILNSTFCADADLVRVGFMHPDDVRQFVQRLEQGGLVFLREDRATDLAVVDQQRGPNTKCDWLQFGRLPVADGVGEVAACWLKPIALPAAGIHIPSKRMDVATPAGWKYEGSLSQTFTFVPAGVGEERLEFLREENGVQVFLDPDTGKERHIGRTKA